VTVLAKIVMLEMVAHNHIKVVITRKHAGTTLVVPYSHAEGLQYVVTGGIRTEEPVIYRVPSYEVRVERGRTYTAVRFGLQNKGTVLKTRTCDAGIGHQHFCMPTWVPGYSPHSFTGSSRRGAWKLFPGKGFLIHEGADISKGQVGGSLGCVEVLNGDWNSFLSEIETIIGTTADAIGGKRLLKVVIEHTHFPLATLVE
jgi:hypothetical protein